MDFNSVKVPLLSDNGNFLPTSFRDGLISAIDSKTADNLATAVRSMTHITRFVWDIRQPFDTHLLLTKLVPSLSFCPYIKDLSLDYTDLERPLEAFQAPTLKVTIFDPPFPSCRFTYSYSGKVSVAFRSNSEAPLVYHPGLQRV